MNRSVAARTALAILSAAIIALMLATTFLVWPYWQRYRVVKAMVEFVRVTPCVCIYSHDRNNERHPQRKVWRPDRGRLLLRLLADDNQLMADGAQPALGKALADALFKPAERREDLFGVKRLGRHDESPQSLNNSLIEVFARVFSSTRLTITAQ